MMRNVLLKVWNGLTCTVWRTGFTWRSWWGLASWRATWMTWWRSTWAPSSCLTGWDTCWALTCTMLAATLRWDTHIYTLDNHQKKCSFSPATDSRRGLSNILVNGYFTEKFFENSDKRYFSLFWLWQRRYFTLLHIKGDVIFAHSEQMLMHQLYQHIPI